MKTETFLKITTYGMMTEENMSKDFVARINKGNAAHDWLEQHGFQPVGLYGRAVVIKINGEYVEYKTFVEAATAQGWRYDK